MSHPSERSAGFAPLARDDARILILGSLPGRRSLAAHQYYAHRQNVFWRIMAELNGAAGSYSERCAALQESGIALWDVLASSVRPGSLDADIEMATATANDFSDFLRRHKHIELICFNGQKAAQLFSRYVAADLDPGSIRMQTLPSTSPAHAAMNYATKRRQWLATIAVERGPIPT